MKTNWIQTYTGKAFYPFDPKIEDIDIEDIAHALALTCRFGGHCIEFYSVAQHSVLVSENLPDDEKLYGLLHDSAEAYLGDIPSPIKKSLIGFKESENNILKLIYQKFKLNFPGPRSIPIMDLTLLYTEHRDLMIKSKRLWENENQLILLPNKIIPLDWKESKRLFLDTYNSLTKV